jgi:predicted nucleic acid-binding protein
MSVVFADAFYFVARLNRRDQHHERVLKFSRDFHARILTSDWVLMEVADALAESESRSRVRDFILHLRSTNACEIVPASRELLDRALELYHQHADKKWTLTDCVSFIIMREQNVTGALTGDKHFEQAGFIALLK